MRSEPFKTAPHRFAAAQIAATFDVVDAVLVLVLAMYALTLYKRARHGRCTHA